MKNNLKKGAIKAMISNKSAELSLVSANSCGGGATYKRNLTSFDFLKISLLLTLAILIFFPTDILAAPASGGLEKVNTLLENVVSWLKYAAVAVVTIAIFVVGYKVLFGGQTIRECAPIIIGAVLIASAAAIADLLVGNI
jgi:trbC/VIRB2 family